MTSVDLGHHCIANDQQYKKHPEKHLHCSFPFKDLTLIIKIWAISGFYNKIVICTFSSVASQQAASQFDSVAMFELPVCVETECLDLSPTTGNQGCLLLRVVKWCPTNKVPY